MTKENAAQLQTRIAKEAAALLRLSESSVSVEPYSKTIRIIGEAWKLPTSMTEEAKRIVASESAKPEIPEADLPINELGRVTLQNVWELFETATQLEDKAERTSLYELACELAEIQNLDDWVVDIVNAQS